MQDLEIEPKSERARGQLQGKTAVVYGATGAVGAAVARAFAQEGAFVLLTGRRRETLAALAADIQREGGKAHASEVDALDEQAVVRHLEKAASVHGRIDVSFDAIGIPQEGIQGIPLLELPVESFLRPVQTYARAHFITARAAARLMAAQGGGALLVHTPSPASVGTPLVGGMTLAWAAAEALTRSLSAELAARGVRAVCLRTSGIPETATIDVVFGLHGKALGVGTAEFRAMVESRSHRQRSNTLAELTHAAVFVASDHGTAFTGTVLNLTAGLSAD